MKVVIAIDSFKGSASSNQLALHIEKGIKKVYKQSEVISCPIADGGEGTVDALSFNKGAKLIKISCQDPLNREVQAKYTILKNEVTVIEMASASGLPLLLEEERNPLITSTYGTGELILDAIKKGARNFIIGLGGSVTNDAGLGMLRALGYSFLDKENKEVKFAKDLSKIVKIDKTKVLKELKDCHFKVACDVNNPLYGRNGASYIYAKQKGANEKIIKELDENLKAFALLVDDKLAQHEGTGAAGGLGFAFLAFLNAKLESGIKIILEEIKLKEKIASANLVITGEGRLDEQSLMGKVISGIGKICKDAKVPCIVLCGSYDEKIDLNKYDLGISSISSIINSPMSLEKAMNKDTTLKLTQEKAEQIFRLIKSLENKKL